MGEHLKKYYSLKGRTLSGSAFDMPDLVLLLEEGDSAPDPPKMGLASGILPE